MAQPHTMAQYVHNACITEFIIAKKALWIIMGNGIVRMFYQDDGPLDSKSSCILYFSRAFLKPR